MNIDYDYWSDLGLTHENVYDPETNIRAATTLIKRMQDRIIDPTPEKIVTLYQGLARDKTSDYGAHGQRVYENKQWEKPYSEMPSYKWIPKY